MNTGPGPGVIWGTAGDAVRPGVGGVVHNDGLIFSNAFQGSSSDGVDAQSDSGVTIVNGYTTLADGITAKYTGAITDYKGPNASDVAGKTQSTIEGGRHGITGGNTGTLNNVAAPSTPTSPGNYTGTGAYTMTITNNAGAIIQGDNGSGINIDGFGVQGAEIGTSGQFLMTTNEHVNVTNYGTISGDGITGDGDGVDVDGTVTILNFGTIVSKDAHPEATDPPGSVEFSEGITVGGGSITNGSTTNYANAVIEGKVSVGNTQAVGRGITLAGIDHDVSDVSFPIQSIYEDSSVTNYGLIKGDTESGITVLGTTGGGYTVTITNNSTGTIEGNNTGVSEDAGGDDHSLNQGAIELDDVGNTYVIYNYGTIQQDNNIASTAAISMHGISNSVYLRNGSNIIGNISGDTSGSNVSTLAIDSNTTATGMTTGGTFNYAGVISNFNTVTIASGTTTFTGANTYTGSTTIDDGATLDLGLGGSINDTSSVSVLGSGAVELTGGSISSITINGGTVSTTSGTVNGLSGTTGLSQNGSGTTNVTGTNNYSGATSVTAGQLNVSGTITNSTDNGERDRQLSSRGRHNRRVEREQRRYVER